MKNPFKKLTKKVKRNALIALVTVGLGFAGVQISPVLIAGGVDLGIQVAEDISDNDD